MGSRAFLERRKRLLFQNAAGSAALIGAGGSRFGFNLFLRSGESEPFTIPRLPQGYLAETLVKHGIPMAVMHAEDTAAALAQLTLEEVVEKTPDLPALPAATLAVMRESQAATSTAHSVARYLSKIKP